ncbi:hypothetical protein [Pseudomonas aeruginosa]|uniref:hypothetical protein n=1 Tax=Pseudomonas aeruginosa TaxID=287 RepID=UPI00070DF637|nr:hypothetical protein [Pseudomonas aeruginosa]
MNQEVPDNDLGFLTPEQYKVYSSDIGSGPNFDGLENIEVIARALVTYLHEFKFLNEERLEGDYTDLVVPFKIALQEASYLEVKKAVDSIRGPIEGLFDRVDNGDF